MRFRDEIEEVAVPDIHLDDAPAAGKGFGDGSLAISRSPPGASAGALGVVAAEVVRPGLS